MRPSEGSCNVQLAATIWLETAMVETEVLAVQCTRGEEGSKLGRGGGGGLTGIESRSKFSEHLPLCWQAH